MSVYCACLSYNNNNNNNNYNNITVPTDIAQQKINATVDVEEIRRYCYRGGDYYQWQSESEFLR